MKSVKLEIFQTDATQTQNVAQTNTVNLTTTARTRLFLSTH